MEFTSYNANSNFYFKQPNLTLSFLEVCSDLKIKIPKDLSIVSFDDIDAFKFTTQHYNSCFPAN